MKRRTALCALFVALAPLGAARAEAGKPSLLERARSAVRRLWEKQQPDVEAGNALAAKGDPAKALEHYERAAPLLQTPRDKAALAFDRSSALLGSGKEGLGKGAEEARHALDGEAPDLQAKAAFNLGYALSEQGKKEEAIAAYGQALQLDPADVDAKHNLELLLREEKKQPRQSAGEQNDKKQPKPDEKKQDQQQQAQGKGDAKQQEPQKKDSKGDQNDAKKPEQQQAQGDKQEQKPQDPKDGQDKQAARGDEQKPQEPQPKPEDRKEQSAQAQPLDRSEAQRLLDALRASEKNLQVWRFGEKRTQPIRRRDATKDW